MIISISSIVIIFLVGAAIFLGTDKKNNSVEASSLWPEHVLTYSPGNSDGLEFGPTGAIATVSESGKSVVVCFPPTGSQLVQWSCPTLVNGLVGAEHASWAHLGNGRWAVIGVGEGDPPTSIPGRITVSLAPADVAQWSDAAAWITTEVTQVTGLQRWLTSFPLDTDGDGIDEVILGSKGPGTIYRLRANPIDPLDVSQWTVASIKPTSPSLRWVMSLEPFDANGDGRVDVLFTDRGGKVAVLLNPGTTAVPWTYQLIASLGAVVVSFGDVADMDRDGDLDVLVAVQGGARVFTRQPGTWVWSNHFYGMPTEMASATPKDVKGLDLDGAGVPVIVLNAIKGGSTGETTGVARIPFVPEQDVPYPNSTATMISSLTGTKFDECKEIRAQYPQIGTTYAYGRQMVPDPSAPPDLVCSGELHKVGGQAVGLWLYLNPLARPAGQ
ncbi:MAG: hypothetical protein G01um101466_4 [Parcubacteria group bacterium Gr01-1014_66]|nr:MAG: hypothetical protein G01um101466_4 [Parcubacteria group bacterium Gr01-1014_66]